MARLKQYDKQELIDRSQYGGSTFDQQHFTDDELRAAAQAREAYRTGQTDMKSAHDFVEGIRSKYGYSGGGDGSMYLPIDMPKDTVPKVGLPSYTPQVDQTNAVYDAAKEAAIAGLKDAYEQSKLDIEHTIAGIPQTYQAQRNAVATQSERDRCGLTNMQTLPA